MTAAAAYDYNSVMMPVVADDDDDDGPSSSSLLHHHHHHHHSVAVLGMPVVSTPIKAPPPLPGDDLLCDIGFVPGQDDVGSLLQVYIYIYIFYSFLFLFLLIRFFKEFFQLFFKIFIFKFINLLIFNGDAHFLILLFWHITHFPVDQGCLVGIVFLTVLPRQHSRAARASLEQPPQR